MRRALQLHLTFLPSDPQFMLKTVNGAQIGSSVQRGRSWFSRLPQRGRRPAWVQIDLDALSWNAREIARRIHPARLAGVVKADAYGHGAVRVAQELERAHAAMLCVALVDEGVELRRSGIKTTVLVLCPAQQSQLHLMREYDLLPSVSSLSQLLMWREFAQSGALTQPIHLDVDTGMSRLGLPVEELSQALEIVRQSPQLRLIGLMSHFGDADNPASPRNLEQESLFSSVIELLMPYERETVALHLANSAAGLYRSRSRLDFVRSGISLYGINPVASDSCDADYPFLAPVMSVVSQIVQVRRIPPGRAVGYSSRWTADRDTVLATIPVGYADGYPWSLCNRADVLIAERRAPVVGAISMDLTTVDVTDIVSSGHDVSEGEEVVLLGSQGSESINAEELARAAGSIPYEVLTRFGQRLARIYTTESVVEAVESRFLEETAH